ncbi:hypothetical protein B0H16DRAFT_1469309 [Mycena metata]|uniref:Uncharacterized protein n=1 Tax=Mycena metata TaxID=1033252 RepID=A0AAD7HY65_9AGAR|nr:hypothetical protein B0H16DRAFT_1469309 [Mycena metata]
MSDLNKQREGLRRSGDPEQAGSKTATDRVVGREVDADAEEKMKLQGDIEILATQYRPARAVGGVDMGCRKVGEECGKDWREGENAVASAAKMYGLGCGRAVGGASGTRDSRVKGKGGVGRNGQGQGGGGRRVGGDDDNSVSIKCQYCWQTDMYSGDVGTRGRVSALGAKLATASGGSGQYRQPGEGLSLSSLDVSA